MEKTLRMAKPQPQPQRHGAWILDRKLLRAAIATILTASATVASAGGAEIAELKRMLQQIKAEYAQKTEALERRLQAAEQGDNATQQVSAMPMAAKGRDALGTLTMGPAFNPQISVILDGNYYYDDANGQGASLLSEADGIGHVHSDEDDHGHSHSVSEQGFNFRSAEIAFSANVDHYADAAAMLAVDADGSVELEEAWFQTRTLPYGLKIKAGKFLSDIGYMNNQHMHSWDFSDQNLAYLNLIGDHGLRDTGVQATWLPDWRHYTLFGLEAFQGKQDKFGALADVDALQESLSAANLTTSDLGFTDTNDGPRLYTAFMKYSPDLGYDHALQLGGWGGWSEQHQEVHGDPAATSSTPLHTLEGNARMWGLDAVYKYDSNGADGQGDFKLQGEYLWQRKDLNLRYHQTTPGAIGAERKFTEDGVYLQGLYGFAPRWQVGLRYDVVGLTNKIESSGSILREFDDSDRWTAALTWKPTEYSQLRLQYSKADIKVDGVANEFDYIYLQYAMSLGSHGAHKF